MVKEIIKSLEFTGLGNKKLGELIEVPKDFTKGDYAFPCFILAKEQKKNPVEIAKNIASKIKMKNFEKVEAFGGYVNFFVNQKEFAKEIIGKISKEKACYGSQRNNEKVVIELSSPNSNKPLHLGHARNIILGQSVGKINEFVGNKVKLVTVNNDRGVHICKSMIAYDKFGNGNTPEKSGKKSDHFVGEFYVKFAKESKKNKKLEEEAQECLRKWERGDKKTLKLWEKVNDWAFEGFAKTYKEFELNFDKEYFESDIYLSGKKVVMKALKDKKVFRKEDGAIYADLNKQGLGEKVLLRGDGTSIYITQDLYLAQKRQKDFKFDKMIYVVANEQDYHFKVLFELLKKFGYSWNNKLEHLNYGLVHLESGRMKSREGTVVDIDELIDTLKKIATKEIEERYKKLHADEVANRAFAISMAALRYYFLKIDKRKDTTFKPKESLSFEGDTGPYLLYSYTRALSVLEKANYRKQKKFEIGKVEECERKLIKELSRFPEIVDKAYKESSPNLIANYCFEIAKTFSKFYQDCPIIGNEEEQFRLKLTDCFSQVMKNSLHLLGIVVIPEM